MAPAIHDAAASSGNTSGTTPLTFNITVTSGATLLVVMAGVDSATDRNPTASSDKDTLTALASGEVIASINNQGCAVFYKVNPTVATHTITISSDLADVNDYLMGIAITFDSTNASTPITDATTDGGNDTSCAVTVPNFAAGDMCVDFVVINAQPTMTANGGQTERVNANTGGVAGSNYGCSTDTSDGSMGWSWAVSRRTAEVGFRLPQASGSRTTKNTRAFTLGQDVGMGWRGNLN